MQIQIDQLLTTFAPTIDTAPDRHLLQSTQ
jgi:hypothetical protein